MGSDDRGASAVLKLHSEGHVMDNNQLVAPVDHKARFWGASLKGALGGLWLGAFLFIAAGRLDWPMAWVYTGISIVDGILLLLLVSSELMHKRTHPKADAKSWDRVLARLTGPLGSTVILVVAGLDKRFGWSAQVPLAVQLAGLAVLVLGMGLMTWAMAVHNYFSLVVRIQKDRGHTVVTGGPYHYVRHPGYVGGIMFQLGTPLLLGSLWTLIPAGLTVLLLIVRTALEDRTLPNELEGYREYAQQTRYRLLPDVW
jgi:protein-S-isoprenylcysteine O-methyltransferase Ste14